VGEEPEPLLESVVLTKDHNVSDKQLTRLEAWPEILADVIKGMKDIPFQYGEHDCCMFGANVVLELTGVDLASKLRTYTTEKGAYKTIKKNGGTFTKMIDAIMKEHGCKPVKRAYCRRGDLVIAMVMTESGKKERALGVCLGAEAAFASDGIQTKPMTEIIRGWHCG